MSRLPKTNRTNSRTGTRNGQQALNSICDHVDDIESVLRTELEQSTMIGDDHVRTGGGGDNENAIDGSETGKESSPAGGKRRKPPRVVLDRHAMARKLSRARGKEVKQQHETENCS